MHIRAMSSPLSSPLMPAAIPLKFQENLTNCLENMECFNHFILILWPKDAFHSNFSILFFYQLHNYKMDNNLHFILLGCKVDNKAIIGIIARFYKFMSQSQSRFSKMVHIILQFLICSPSYSQLSAHYCWYVPVWVPTYSWYLWCGPSLWSNYMFTAHFCC